MIDFERSTRVVENRKKLVILNYLKFKKSNNKYKRVTIIMFIIVFLLDVLLFFQFTNLIYIGFNLSFEFVAFITISPIYLYSKLQKRAESKKAVASNRLAQYNKANDDLQKINEIVEREKDFILYLRDFSGAGQKKINYGISEHDISLDQFGKETTKLCIDFFSGFYPVIVFDCDFDNSRFLNALFVYCDNSSWFDLFKNLVSKSKYVVIDYDWHKLSPGVEKEIETLSIQSKKNIVWIGKEEDISFVETQYKALYQNIVLFMKTEEVKGLDLKKIDFTEFEDMDKI